MHTLWPDTDRLCSSLQPEFLIKRKAQISGFKPMTKIERKKVKIAIRGLPVFTNGAVNKSGW